jgi:hypothetical protein
MGWKEFSHAKKVVVIVIITVTHPQFVLLSYRAKRRSSRQAQVFLESHVSCSETEKYHLGPVGSYASAHFSHRTTT